MSYGFPPPGAPAAGTPAPAGRPAHHLGRGTADAPAKSSPTLGTAHKPGIVPLRPLRLGDMFEAAFRLIRSNPGATAGAAVLVSAVAMLLPLVALLPLRGLGDRLVGDLQTSGTTREDALLLISTLFGTLSGSVLQWFGLIFVTGIVALVSSAALLGRRTTLAEGWARTRGARWRLLGLALLLAAMMAAPILAWLVGTVLAVALLPGWVAAVLSVVGLLPLIAVLVYLWTRVTYLAPSVLMVERLGILASIARGHRLTRGNFWRTFGIRLLTVMVTGFAAQMLSMPFAVVAQVATFVLDDSLALVVMMVANALSTVVASAFVTPFTAAVATLQYVDLRMRHEAYDVELMDEVGMTAW